MANIKLPPDERKENLNIRIKKRVIDQIRKHPNYSNIIEKLIEDYLKKNNI